MAVEDAFESRVLPDLMDLRAYLDSHMFAGIGPDDDQMDAEVEDGITSANLSDQIVRSWTV
ncbi:MAG: hypothetical protein ACRDGS_06410 [Chloroflexota bacterium]